MEDRLQVSEGGHGELRLHTESPHLVSLGGGRLSTAVTLHPLPPGRVTIGSGNNVDIPVLGTGVEDVHCYIENSGGLVTLHPMAEMTSIDGQKVTAPTRLTQGSMLCIGRSNYLRFNHPAEARLMKSILPNTRLSVAPLNFLPGEKESMEVFQQAVRAVDSLERKPPVAPRGRSLPQNSDSNSLVDDLATSLQSCVLGKVSKFESLAHANSQNSRHTSPPNPLAVFSPKVFPAGSATVNTPAKDVLGPDRAARRAASNAVDVTPNLRNEANDYSNSYSNRRSGDYENHDFHSQNGNCRSKSPHEDLMSHSVVGLPGNPLGNGNVMVYDDFPNIDRHSRSNTPNTKLFQSSGLMSASLVAENCREGNRTQTSNTIEALSSSCTNSFPTQNGTTSTPSAFYQIHGSSSPSPSQPLSYNGVGAFRNVTPSSSCSESPANKSSSISLTNKSVASITTAGSSGRRTPVSLAECVLNANLRQRVGSPNPSLSGSTCSLEELAVRGNELEVKRKQAVVERMMEQEVERKERARLDEILSMCAEYERQVQKERVLKPQQKSSRIKTNGSLPRDKRNAGSLSPVLSPQRTSSSTDDIHQMFSFETNGSLHSSPSHHVPSSGGVWQQQGREHTSVQSQPSGGKTPHYENYVLPEQAASSSSSGNFFNYDSAAYGSTADGQGTTNTTNSYENVLFSSPVHPGSPRTRIRTVACAKEPASLPATLPRDITQEVLENRLALADYEKANSHQKAESRSTPNSRQHGICTSTPTGNDITGISPKFFESPFMQNGVGSSPRHVSNDWNTPHSTPKSIHSRNRDTDKFILPLDEPVSGQKLVACAEAAERLSKDYNDKRDSDRECERDSGVPASPTQEGGEKANGKTCSVEVEVLRKEKSKILLAMTVLKGKLTDIEQQEEELERELEMERALIEAELRTQGEKLRIEEGRLNSLRERVSQLDADMAECQAREVQRQVSYRQNLERAEIEAERLEAQLITCIDAELRGDLEDRLRHQHDLVDTERKLFEDLEFRQLEEEAGWLAGREELQRELTEAAARVAARHAKVDLLQSQTNSTGDSAQSESRTLEEQRVAYLRRLEQGRQRLEELDSRLEELSQQGLTGLDSSHDASSETDEDKPNLNRKTSQDDLDRISRVTSGAPLDISDTGSLGRKTLESLKEIERNRQLHLAKQGSLVIEQERRRVQQLKRRVADEVRAQWEERRQREMNCSSLTSVASEDSSLTSSDMHTESASGDDALGKVDLRSSALTDRKAPSESAPELGTNEKEPDDAPTNDHMVAEQQAQRDRLLEETRPLSDASSYDDHLSVRMRDKTSRLQQRPLTRYLPIRGESLNLRQHIESAGHQIELCPHVILDAVSCRGVLHKMASRFHSWQKRWFVFDRSQRTLAYYSNRTEGKPRGGAYFQFIEEVYVDHLNSVKSPHPHLTFVVKTRDRTYHLMAPSAEAMRIWVDVIFTGAEGYQEFEHGS